MSYFARGKYEYVLYGLRGVNTVLTCSTSYTARSGGHLYFGAEERGTLQGPEIPEHLRGYAYIKRLPPALRISAAQLREDDPDSVLPDLIDALSREQVTAESSRDAVWTLFWKLVLAVPSVSFVEELDHEELTFQRERALKRAPSGS